MLCFKGPNMFAGYLEYSKATHAAFDARGWYVTGDLGRLDEDGFLFIEGRLSRFSKIGGEMVPHAKLEEEIQKTLSSGDSQTQSFAVLGTTDSSKGEKLVILTTIEMNLQDLRKNLLANGIPNLWIPKEIKFIEEMPMLASGKLDLSKLQKLANEN